MILLRQRTYAVVSPLFLARRVSQGKGSLQTVVNSEKANLDAVIERWKKMHPGKNPPKRLIREKLNQIKQSQQSLQRDIKFGIQRGIPEQYAERSVLGNMVGQNGIARSEGNATRAGRRYLRHREQVQNINTANGKFSGFGSFTPADPGYIELPSMSQHFMERDKSHQDAAERLKSHIFLIMKLMEEYVKLLIKRD